MTQLALFDEFLDDAAASARPPPLVPATPFPPSPPAPMTNPTVAHLATAAPGVAPDAAAAASPPALPSAAPGFHHPQATHRVRLSGRDGAGDVAYLLRRARRRTIGFVVTADGLAVSAPRWVTLGEIESGIHQKAAWILRKLQEQREQRARLDAARIEWKDGVCIPFLGETVIVVLDPRQTGAMLNTDAAALPGVPRLTLHLGLPHHATALQIRDAVQAWLQRQAKRIFEERSAHFAARLGVTVKRLSLTSAGTRWGSASGNGSVRLNWRLVHFGLSTIDYVVAHELAHLREMNHSPAFWEVVRSVMPDFEHQRQQLRADALPQYESD